MQFGEKNCKQMDRFTHKSNFSNHNLCLGGKQEDFEQRCNMDSLFGGPIHLLREENIQKDSRIKGCGRVFWGVSLIVKKS